MALALPGSVREVLARAAQGPAEALGLRAVAPESLHVTLCFLGGRPTYEVPAVASALDAVAALPAATLAPAGALWLPGRRPRVLAVALDDVGGGAARVQSALSAALAAGGWYEPERRPFLPHVTVARVRGTVPPLRTAGLSAGELPLHEFTAGELVLLRSRPGPQGSRYEALHSVLLQPVS